jgi:hypothetical protein
VAIFKSVKQFLKRFFLNKYEVLTFAGLWLLSFLLIFRYQLVFDDVAFSATIQEKGLWGWVVHISETWQPRVLMYLVTGFFLEHVWAWKIVNSFALAVAGFSIYKLSAPQEKAGTADAAKKTLLFTNSLLFLIYPGILLHAFVWLTGSTNYCIPFAIMILCLAPFIQLMRGSVQIIGKSKMVLYVLGITYVCQIEQTALISTAFSLSALFYSACIKHKKIPKRFSLYALYIVLFSGIYLFSTLHSPRVSLSIYYYPDFPMSSLYDKFFQAVNLTNYEFTHHLGLIFLVASILLTIVMWRKYRTTTRYLPLIPLIYSINTVFPFERFFAGDGSSYGFADSITGLFGTGIFSAAAPSNLNTSPFHLFPSALCLLAILIFGICLALAFDNRAEGVLFTLLYFIGLFSGYANFVSATIFASGTRIFFFGGMLLVLVAAGLFRLAVTCLRPRTVNIGLLGIAAISASMYIRLLAFTLQGIYL